MIRIEDVVVDVFEDVVALLRLDKPFSVHSVLAHVVIDKVEVLYMAGQSLLRI